ncbi:transcription cofactor HES-6-like [Trichomycterus rosablanca]|uniref:transcription cofactor HES-6-like n=1 Tax=Trichomycterus rosablanca TaxID=2290929 RepID=UPI002F35D344
MAHTGNPTFWMVTDEDECRGDRKTRKPLVEKKRRARINESLQELRGLLSDTELHAKMENAEVLELTVKRVEDILQDRSHEGDSMSREESERFAAGYIQCMHEVHTFVSTCPGIDATVAAELLNHLLECMPLNEDLQDVILDFGSEVLSPTPSSPGAHSPTAPSPSASTGDDTCSELDETFGEASPVPAEEEKSPATGPTLPYSSHMWRPW